MKTILIFSVLVGVTFAAVQELTRNKPAVQSTTRLNGKNPARLALDGKEQTDFWSGYPTCSHTRDTGEDNPWWRVDLQGEYDISKVEIVSRTDGWWNRLDGFKITVGNSLVNNGNDNPACVKGEKFDRGGKKEFVCSKPLTGRYVNIMVPGQRKYLSLCEVYVYGVKSTASSGSKAPTGIQDLSKNKPTAQSSTRFGNPSALAVDGVDTGGMTCAMTSDSGQSTDPWWRVDLQGEYDVSKVEIVTRTDCCWDKMDGFQITVGDSLADNGNHNAACVKGGKFDKGGKKEFSCYKPLTGKYVNIMLPGVKKMLILCQVKVLGVKSSKSGSGTSGKPSPVNWRDLILQGVEEVAHGKTTAQSSTRNNNPAKLAIDGKENTDFWSANPTCSHTSDSGENNPWWRVDLQKEYKVFKVDIVSRIDGRSWWERMNGFQITVGNSLVNNGNDNTRCLTGGKFDKGGKKEFICSKPLTGRYVNIMIPGLKKYLCLCEVYVFAIKGSGKSGSGTSGSGTSGSGTSGSGTSGSGTSGSGKSGSGTSGSGKPALKELAHKKPAVQSTTRLGGYNPARLAVDGREVTDFNSRDPTCSHTKDTGEDNPWWRVDLQGKYKVSKVDIVSRTDGWWERLNGFQITVGDSLADNGNSNAACITGGIVDTGGKKTFVCNKPLTGRYVNIKIPGQRKYLALCEVLVYGTS